MKSQVAAKEDENPNARKGFFEWFCRHKIDSILSGMLKPVRQEAGLGVPPSSFTTNTCESINAVLKRKVDFKKNELPTFVTHLKQLAEEQEREVERAVIGRGKYQFVEQYRFLEVKEVDWFRMTQEQRKRHMHKVATVQLKSAEIPSEQASCSILSMQMSVPAEEFQEGLKIPLQAVQALWRKAEELVGNSNAISPAPGYDSTCKMVISRSGKRPHLVTSSKKGKYTCDNDCPNFKSMGICSHTVAVDMNRPQYDGIFSVCFRSGNISVCNGCRNKNSLPPNDICIQHEEWRSYISPVTKLPESRFGNAYYHANPLCIRARWPLFFPGHLIVPVDVQSRLLPQHKLLLSAFGVNV